MNLGHRLLVFAHVALLVAYLAAAGFAVSVAIREFSAPFGDLGIGLVLGVYSIGFALVIMVVCGFTTLALRGWWRGDRGTLVGVDVVVGAPAAAFLALSVPAILSGSVSSDYRTFLVLSVVPILCAALALLVHPPARRLGPD